jgi:hypothetical protein
MQAVPLLALPDGTVAIRSPEHKRSPMEVAAPQPQQQPQQPPSVHHQHQQLQPADPRADESDPLQLGSGAEDGEEDELILSDNEQDAEDEAEADFDWQHRAGAPRAEPGQIDLDDGSGGVGAHVYQPQAVYPAAGAGAALTGSPYSYRRWEQVPAGRVMM